MDAGTLYHRTVEAWATQVNDVRADQWDRRTPCSGWTVRDLVNHVAGEDRWTRPLMEGRTIADVGDSLDGDLLGSDPIGAALDAAKDAVAAVAERLPRHERVHLSYGDEEPDEYVRQLAADHLVHGWDLAAATGSGTHLDPQLVAAVGAWFAEREDLYRSAGLVGPRARLTGDPQADLLAQFGRVGDWGDNHATLAAFSAAFAAGDVDALMDLVTDDVVFDSTGPSPDGRRHEGRAAVREVWRDLFATTTDPSFTEEESFVCGDRAVVRWRYSWSQPGADDGTGHVRGVDVFRFSAGLVSEKLSYVKG
jgi:uncharacterized protein (TIGR03086 family)